PYRLVARLGEGGMGAVYRGVPASQWPSEEGAVAVKILQGDLVKDPSFRDRFRREFRLLKSLHHPAIVHVEDFGEQEGEGLMYLAMEEIRGTTLRSRVREGGLPLRECLDLVRPVFEGLTLVHGRGILH